MNKEIEKYHKLLSEDYPTFINEYIKCPCLKRLSGVGLFCGLDYTRIIKPHYFYSRLDHSIGVALIIWHFTHDKKQAIAGLLHDVSSPAFSHVIDFKNKDYLNQESTEKLNDQMIKEDFELLVLLKRDQIDLLDVIDYKAYPIADNHIPSLSADRLEYLYATGLIVTNSWDLEKIKASYQDINIQFNEDNIIELGFQHQNIATMFFTNILNVSKLYLRDDNKIILQLLAVIIDKGIRLNIIKDQELYQYSEVTILNKLSSSNNLELITLINTFKNTTKVYQSTKELPNTFCIKLAVKKRYVDPLLNEKRLSNTSIDIKDLLASFLNLSDNYYICLNYIT